MTLLLRRSTPNSQYNTADCNVIIHSDDGTRAHECSAPAWNAEVGAQIGSVSMSFACMLTDIPSWYPQMALQLSCPRERGSTRFPILRDLFSHFVVLSSSMYSSLRRFLEFPF